MKLNRHVQLSQSCGRKEARRLIATGAVEIDGEVETDGHAEVGRFTQVSIKGEVSQDKEAVYVKLHKPSGYVSATADPDHQTVMELLPEEWRGELHLAGRLDKQTSGLLILTNDGDWSRRLTEPDECVGKVYRVWTEKAISEETAGIFSKGIYFGYEDLTTGAAELELVGEKEALLTIYEGRYHQVKRMFHAVGNRVVKLHRECVGRIQLGELPVAEWQQLSDAEVEL